MAPPARATLGELGDLHRRERDKIPAHLAENPGLQSRDAELFASAYRLARREAARQTRLPLATFPEEPPFTPEQALDEAFWPE